MFKTKLNENGEVDKCKVRLVEMGYAHQYSTNYNEVFTPITRWDTIQMVIVFVSQKVWCIYQLDIKSTFLHRELNEVVYIKHP